MLWENRSFSRKFIPTAEKLKPRLVWVPKFSINECKEMLFKLPNAENLFNC